MAGHPEVIRGAGALSGNPMSADRLNSGGLNSGQLPLTRAGVLGLVRWLAARSQADVYPHEGTELGSFGDQEVQLVVSVGGVESEGEGVFTLACRNRGHARSVARSSHLDDLLRFLVVHVVLLPGRSALPEQPLATRDPELRIRTVGAEVEVRWTAFGAERVLAIPATRVADLDLFARCRSGTAEDIVASKCSANGFPLLGPRS